MKTLSKQIVRGHFVYTQLKRDGDVAIYEQQKKRSPKSACLRYEVIRITRAQRNLYIGDTLIHEMGDEIYPASSQWGIYGWTFLTLKDAESKFQCLLASTI